MILIISGTRDCDDPKIIQDAFDLSDLEKPSIVYHGGARGIDTLAGRWSAENGIPVKVFPAQWKKHGKAAGMIRNQEMLDAALATGEKLALLAIPGPNSIGTWGMVDITSKHEDIIRCVCFSLIPIPRRGIK